MFADSTLGARIDRAEGRMCALFAEYGAEPASPELGPLVLPISGGVAVFAGQGSPVNKLIGLGFDQPLDEGMLTEIEQQWRARGEPVRIEMSILTDPAIGGALTDRGYGLHGFENVLARSIDGTVGDDMPAGVTVEPLGDADFDVWADIAIDAFLNLDGTGSVADDGLSREQLKQTLRSYSTMPGMVRYLARIDGTPVGEAAMRIDGDIAQMAGAGTLPAYRGRGVQKALVQHRLLEAQSAGCDLAVVATAPGTRSQDNVMRRGFELLYARAILVKRWSGDA
jgi:N-acetylglutamate synthase-like GNAT family acetyltransferase